MSKRKSISEPVAKLTEHILPLQKQSTVWVTDIEPTSGQFEYRKEYGLPSCTQIFEYTNRYGSLSHTRLCTQISEYGMVTSQYQWSIRYAAVFTRFLMMVIIIQVNKGCLRNLQRCQWQVSRVDNCPHRSWQNRRLCRALSFRMLLTPLLGIGEMCQNRY